MKTLQFTGVIVIMVLCLHNNCLKAWEGQYTHPALTYEAIRPDNQQSNLDTFLREQLGLTDGLSSSLVYDTPYAINNRIFDGGSSPFGGGPKGHSRTILDWLVTGGIIDRANGDSHLYSIDNG